MDSYSLDDIYEDYREDLPNSYPLVNFVPGVGPVPCDLVFVGEAPGKFEDKDKEPFVGPAGKVLNQALEDALILRSEVFITNIIKYRPPGNRTPNTNEVREAFPYLLRELECIHPRLVVCLGLVAFRAFSPYDKPNYHHTYTLHGFRVIPAYHPAFTLHSESPVVKKVFFDQIRRVRDALDYERKEAT